LPSNRLKFDASANSLRRLRFRHLRPYGHLDEICRQVRGETVPARVLI
jgi:hypothetical protein